MRCRSHLPEASEQAVQAADRDIETESNETKWVRSGKFLGYMVSKNGMEANPDKVKAILDMSPPKTIKEVQRLTGRMAALNRFLSKSAERGQMTKWAIELGEHDISFQPRTAIKAKALADFIAEEVSLQSEAQHDENAMQVDGTDITQSVENQENSRLVLYVDGASNKEGSGADLVLTSPEMKKVFGLNTGHSYDLCRRQGVFGQKTALDRLNRIPPITSSGSYG
ncbi:hypothetical protein Sango_3099700 [Sesamum angolense]|uniref:Uncharacterized protein n=1 Tax=Sesamum angolense TaxID=2727404 RepID=A0AAE1T9I4_9LAMI|nr:hypothetical protein Sango_3099700 [Sesamum angolense]